MQHWTLGISIPKKGSPDVSVDDMEDPARRGKRSGCVGRSYGQCCRSQDEAE